MINKCLKLVLLSSFFQNRSLRTSVFLFDLLAMKCKNKVSIINYLNPMKSRSERVPHNINQAGELDITAVQNRHLKLVESEEPEEVVSPTIDKETLNEMCFLEIEAREMYDLPGLLKSNPNLFANIIYRLAHRDFANELPVEAETITYKRNLEECAQLRLAAVKLLDKMQKGEPVTSADRPLVDQAARLLTLELRKAKWTEQNYYPVVFQHAIDTAEADVMRFLVHEKNVNRLDELNDPDNYTAGVNLDDPLSYVMAGHKPNSAGEYKGGKVSVCVPEYYTEKNEWDVYRVVVHEMIHHVSHFDQERLGLRHHQGEPNYNEINEAMTEILTFYVLNRRKNLDTGSLRGTPQNIALENLAYKEYTFIVTHIFSKIPDHYFADAMLNEDGFKRLRDKFDEVFGPGSLIRFGKNMRDIYKAPAAVN